MSIFVFVYLFVSWTCLAVGFDGLWPCDLAVWVLGIVLLSEESFVGGCLGAILDIGCHPWGGILII